MKKILTLLSLATIVTSSCSKDDNPTVYSGCGNSVYMGHQLYVDLQNRCYYLDTGNNMVYIDRSFCKGC